MSSIISATEVNRPKLSFGMSLLKRKRGIEFIYGSAYCEKEIRTYLSVVFLFRLGLQVHCLPCTRCGAHPISPSRFILQTWQKTHPGEKDDCILLGSGVGSAQLRPGKIRGSAEERAGSGFGVALGWLFCDCVNNGVFSGCWDKCFTPFLSF